MSHATEPLTGRSHPISLQRVLVRVALIRLTLFGTTAYILEGKAEGAWVKNGRELAEGVA
jgi:hypothetical protein